MASSAATAENWQGRDQHSKDVHQPAHNEHDLVRETTKPQDASQAAKWQLSVVQGLHQGALVALRDGELVVVGSGDDCDIQLFDADVAARHLALMMRDAKVSVRALEGAIVINDKPATPGIQRVLGTGDKIGLAAGAVQLLLSNYTTDAESADKNEQKHPSGNVAVKPSDAKSGSLSWLLMPLIVLTLIATVAVTVLRGYMRQAVSGPLNPQSVQALLVELKLQKDINIEETEAGVTLRGALRSEPMARLSAALVANNLPVQLRIGSVEQLLEQVRDVFRTNGYGARLKYLGAGKVRVENLDGGNKVVQKIAEYVKQDVRDLQTLSFAPFEQADSEGEPELYIPPSGKRLTTIIDGDTAYVATEDGGRYFAGSALPGGYHIRRITAKGVQADKDGAITWLRF